jgi:hypothetical protein
MAVGDKARIPMLTRVDPADKAAIEQLATALGDIPVAVATRLVIKEGLAAIKEHGVNALRTRTGRRSASAPVGGLAAQTT